MSEIREKVREIKKKEILREGKIGVTPASRRWGEPRSGMDPNAGLGWREKGRREWEGEDILGDFYVVEKN